MIGDAKKRQIQALLKKGVPHRRIATSVGVNRATVSNVAKGMQPSKPCRFPLLEIYEPSGHGYCGVCRRKVTMPCLKCLLLSQGKEDTGSVRATDLDLNLEGDERERQRQLYATRSRASALERIRQLSERKKQANADTDMENCFTVDESEV